MRLELESGEVPGAIDSAAVERALRTLGQDGDSPSFAILSRAEEEYVQARVESDGFIVEKRDGHAGAHFSAVRSGSSVEPRQRFTRAEMIEIFCGYLEGSEPDFVRWVPLGLGG